MRWLRKLQGVGLAVGAFLTLSAETLEIDEQELECEQAVAHVNECCPGFDPHRFNCTFIACESHPNLSIDESRCIEGKSCDEIRARGLCDAPPVSTALDGGVDNSLAAEACR